MEQDILVALSGIVGDITALAIALSVLIAERKRADTLMLYILENCTATKTEE